MAVFRRLTSKEDFVTQLEYEYTTDAHTIFADDIHEYVLAGFSKPDLLLGYMITDNAKKVSTDSIWEIRYTNDIKFRSEEKKLYDVPSWTTITVPDIIIEGILFSKYWKLGVTRVGILTVDNGTYNFDVLLENMKKVNYRIDISPMHAIIRKFTGSDLADYNKLVDNPKFNDFVVSPVGVTTINEGEQYDYEHDTEVNPGDLRDFVGKLVGNFTPPEGKGEGEEGGSKRGKNAGSTGRRREGEPPKTPKRPPKRTPKRTPTSSPKERGTGVSCVVSFYESGNYVKPDVEFNTMIYNHTEVDVTENMKEHIVPSNGRVKVVYKNYDESQTELCQSYVVNDPDETVETSHIIMEFDGSLTSLILKRMEINE